MFKNYSYLLSFLFFFITFILLNIVQAQAQANITPSRFADIITAGTADADNLLLKSTVDKGFKIQFLQPLKSQISGKDIYGFNFNLVNSYAGFLHGIAKLNGSGVELINLLPSAGSNTTVIEQDRNHIIVKKSFPINAGKFDLFMDMRMGYPYVKFWGELNANTSGTFVFEYRMVGWDWVSFAGPKHFRFMKNNTLEEFNHTSGDVTFFDNSTANFTDNWMMFWFDEQNFTQAIAFTDTPRNIHAWGPGFGIEVTSISISSGNNYTVPTIFVLPINMTNSSGTFTNLTQFLAHSALTYPNNLTENFSIQNDKVVVTIAVNYTNVTNYWAINGTPLLPIPLLATEITPAVNTSFNTYLGTLNLVNSSIANYSLPLYPYMLNYPLVNITGANYTRLLNYVSDQLANQTSTGTWNSTNPDNYQDGKITANLMLVYPSVPDNQSVIASAVKKNLDYWYSNLTYNSTFGMYYFSPDQNLVDLGPRSAWLLYATVLYGKHVNRSYIQDRWDNITKILDTLEKLRDWQGNYWSQVIGDNQEVSNTMEDYIAFSSGYFASRFQNNETYKNKSLINLAFVGNAYDKLYKNADVCCGFEVPSTGRIFEDRRDESSSFGKVNNSLWGATTFIWNVLPLTIPLIDNSTAIKAENTSTTYHQWWNTSYSDTDNNVKGGGSYASQFVKLIAWFKNFTQAEDRFDEFWNNYTAGSSNEHVEYPSHYAQTLLFMEQLKEYGKGNISNKEVNTSRKDVDAIIVNSSSPFVYLNSFNSSIISVDIKLNLTVLGTENYTVRNKVLNSSKIEFIRLLVDLPYVTNASMNITSASFDLSSNNFSAVVNGTGSNKNLNFSYNVTSNVNIYDSNISNATPVVELRNNQIVATRNNFSATYNSSTHILSLTIPTLSEHNLTFVPSRTEGGSCIYNEDCTSNVCCHNTCRSSCPYCGDNYCDASETCSICSSDCGACPTYGGSIASYSMEFLNISKSIEVVQNSSATACFVLSNNGNRILENIQISIEGISPNWFAFSPKFIKELLVNQNVTICLNLNIPIDAQTGEYTLTLTGKNKVSISRTLKLQILQKSCSVCPQCSEWSDCINLKQSRICYSCNERTGFQCEQYSETKDCVIEVAKKDSTSLILFSIIFISLIIAFIYELIKGKL